MAGFWILCGKRLFVRLLVRVCARLITLISVELESRGGGGYNQRVWIGRSFVRSLG